MAIVLGLLISGCGIFGDDDDDSNESAAPTVTSAESSPTPTLTVAPTETATPSPSPTPSATPTATATSAADAAQASLDSIAAEWANTNSVHFELKIDGTTYLDAGENIELQSANGDLLRPDSAQAEAKVGVGFAGLSVNIVIIGNDAYITNFLSGNWERAPSGFDFNPAILFDEKAGLGSILAGLQEPEIIGTEDINGTEAEHVTGLVNNADISALVAGSLQGNDIEMHVWAATDTHELLRLSLTEADASIDNPTTWQLDFSNHNENVEITAPDV